MGLARLLGVCVAVLFASSVSAANIIDLGPSDYRDYGSGPASHTSGGVRSSFPQAVRLPPTGTNLPVTRNAVIPYGSIANGLKNFVRVNPASIAASAAVTGLFLAVDWVWDEAEGKWGKQGFEVVDPEGGIYWVMQGKPIDERLTSPEAVCQYWYGEIYGAGNTNTSVSRVSDTQFICTASNKTGPGSVGTPVFLQGPGCPPGTTYDGLTGRCVIPGIIDLSPSDWSELESELPGLPASAVSEAAGDTQRKIGNPLPGYSDQDITGPSSVSGPETTSSSTDPVNGDTIITSTSTQTNISYGPTTITTTNTTTSTTHVNGQPTETTVTTETPGELPVSSGGGAAGQWPGFCDWASVVCEWIDWTREEPPAEEDLPAVIDDEFYEQKSISFGSKACPAPHEINLPFLATTVGVSFQPLCDFASIIYYMVMAASYIIAAYISIGVARNA